MPHETWLKLCALGAVGAAVALAASCTVPDFQIADFASNAPDSSVDAATPSCASAASDCGSNAEPDGAVDCSPACENEHGSTRCTLGQCAPICASGFADCNGDPSDGCETDLSTETDCGACGAACKLDHATPQCDSDVCTVAACEPASRIAMEARKMAAKRT